MAQTIFGADFAVSALNRAFFNTSPGNSVFNSHKSTAGTTEASQRAFATQMARQFESVSDADLAELVLTNMGILPSSEPDVVALETALADYFSAVGTESRGIVVLQLSEILANLENATGNLAVYNASAKAWNKEVLASFNYSSNAANTSPFEGDFPAGNPSDGQTFTLTTGQDVFNGTEGNDLVRGVAGQAVGTQDQTTLNSSDILKGGAGADTLILLLNGAYGGGATIRDFETLQLGTNNALASFDYNVNQGAYEITGTDTIVYDQITTGEALVVNNITPTADGDVAPELVWANEAGSRAGMVSANYRQATIAERDDNQNVTLKNVSGMAAIGDAILNIGGGMESVTITSTGAVANNTLNYSTNVDATGSNGGAADIISAGSLGTVILKGDVAIGKTGGVIAATNPALQGLTDRIAGADFGPSPWGTPTDSNLLSVGSRVTEVDASEMTGAANVRFVAKTNGSATDVTFKGGAGNDYVEFELGNVTATGGEGNDTFAFIGNGANATFGEGDKLEGGEGTDTIQLGLNGAGTFNISETELRNKTSIDVLDMRGNENNLTLSSDFVAASDAGNRVAVHTDRIIQTSADNAANAAGNANNGLENNSTNTVRLTQLTSSQGVDFFGGSGSDRIILNDRTFNVLQKLDGGAYNDAALVGAGRADTITVVTNGENVVIDAQDLSNVSNFEGLVLTKNAANARYDITLTEQFVLANTQTSNRANTTWDDSVFQLGTVAAANNNALGAGDVVRIDISDLFVNGNAKTSLAGRGIDVSSLPAGSVQFIVNGAAATAAQIAAVTKVDAARADVLGSAANAAAPAPAPTPVALTAGGTFTGTAGVNDIFTGNIASLVGTTITGTAADTETLTLTDAGVVGLPATVTNIDVLNLANGVNTVTFAAGSGFTTINGGTGNDNIALSDANNQAGGAAATVLTVNGNNGNDTLTVGGGLDLSNDNVTNFETLAVGVNALTVGAGAALDQFSTVTFGAGGSLTVANGAHSLAMAAVTLDAGSNTITINNGASLTINGDATLAAGTADIAGAGTLVTTGNLTLTGATDTVARVTFGQAGVTVTDNGVLAAGRIYTGSAGSDTLALDALGAATNAVTFNGFQVGAGGDRIDLSGAGAGNNVDLTTMAAGGSIAGSIAAAPGAIVSLVALSGAAAQVNGAFTTANVINAITSAGLTGNALGFVYVALDNGTDSAIFRVALNANDGGAGVDVAGDIGGVTQLVTLTGVADVGTLTAANIA